MLSPRNTYKPSGTTSIPSSGPAYINSLADDSTTLVAWSKETISPINSRPSEVRILTGSKMDDNERNLVVSIGLDVFQQQASYD